MYHYQTNITMTQRMSKLRYIPLLDNKGRRFPEKRLLSHDLTWEAGELDSRDLAQEAMRTVRDVTRVYLETLQRSGQVKKIIEF